jgi:hypothetical protein
MGHQDANAHAEKVLTGPVSGEEDYRSRQVMVSGTQ